MNEVLSQLHARKSVRAFLDRPISPEARRAILEAACAAPTAGNQQLYTILDITDQAVKDTLADTCDHQPFIAQAPLVLLFCADCQKWYDAFAAGGCSPRRPGPGDLWLALSDANIAAQNAVTAAWSLGIGSCYIGDILEQVETHGPCSACRSTWCPPSCWCLATPRSSSRSGKSPAPRLGAHRPRERLPPHGAGRAGGYAGRQRRSPALRCVAGRLLQAQVQLRFLPRDVPLHGRVPQALSAVKTPAPGFGWKPGAGLHFPACFGKMEPVPANREERCL